VGLLAPFTGPSDGIIAPKTCDVTLTARRSTKIPLHPSAKTRIISTSQSQSPQNIPSNASPSQSRRTMSQSVGLNTQLYKSTPPFHGEGGLMHSSAYASDGIVVPILCGILLVSAGSCNLLPSQWENIHGKFITGE